MIKKILIDQYDITEKGYGILDFALEEEIELVNNSLTFPTARLKIHDFDKSFNPHSPISLFYGHDIRKFLVSIFDEVNNKIFQGNVLNITSDIAIQEVNIEMENSLAKVYERGTQFVQDVEDLRTPADIMKDILIINGLNSNINHPSFDYTSNNQRLQSFFVGVTFSIEDNTTIKEALEKLSYISGADLYYTDNQIYLRPYVVPDNTKYPYKTFTKNDILSLETNINHTYLRNNYSVDVKGVGDSINQIFTDENFNNIGQESRLQYGIKDLETYNLNVDSSQVFSNITSSASISAINSAENFIRRFQSPLVECNFKIYTSEHQRMRLGEFINIDITDLHYELENKLLYVIGLTRNESEGVTEIKALQDIS